MASQNDSRNTQGNQSNQSNQSAQNAQSARGPNNSSNDRSGEAQAARSEEQLDREQQSLIGNTAEDRNLTGSTTYVTLPDQQGDEAQDQSSSRKAGGSRGSNNPQPSSGRSSRNQENGRDESYGSSRGDTQR